jgi:hypothetical protein
MLYIHTYCKMTQEKIGIIDRLVLDILAMKFGEN